MSDFPQEIFSLTDEEVLLALIEGGPVDQARAEALLRRFPAVRHEIDAMRTDRVRLASQGAALAPDWIGAEVVRRFETAREPLQLRHMDAPPRAARVWQWTPAQGRALAAAAALSILAGVIAIAYTNRPSPRSPLFPLSDGSHLTTLPSDPEFIDVPAFAHSDTHSHSDGAMQLVAMVEQHWLESNTRPEPSLTEAVRLMAQGRLVIRALASSPGVATAASDALDKDLPSESKAWTLAGRVSAAIEQALARPRTSGPVFAMNSQTQQQVEIPAPHLHASWAVRVNQDATAIASVLHALRGQGLLVRLEESAEPVPLISLDGAVWWDSPTSTWTPSPMVPIVVEAIDR